MVEVLGGSNESGPCGAGAGGRGAWPGGRGGGTSPLHSCRRRCSGSSGAGGRNGRSHTTSFGPGCPARPRSCTAAPGSRPPYPRPHPLRARARGGQRDSDFLGGRVLPGPLPVHPPRPPLTYTGSLGSAIHILVQASRCRVPAQGPTSGEDARVHEGGHAEVGQDKEEDDAIVDGNSWGHSSSQPWAPELDSRAELGLGVQQMGGDRTWGQTP